MPVSLAKLLQADVATLKVDVGLPEPLRVTYVPARVTGEQLALMQTVGESEDLALICETFAGIIDSWDLEDEQGERLPVTQGTLLKLPIRVLTKVLEAVSADINPQTRRG